MTRISATLTCGPVVIICLWTSAMIHVNHYCDDDVIGVDDYQMTLVMMAQHSAYWDETHLHGEMFKTEFNYWATSETWTRLWVRVFLPISSNCHDHIAWSHWETGKLKQHWGESDQLFYSRYILSWCQPLWLDYTDQWTVTMNNFDISVMAGTVVWRRNNIIWTTHLNYIWVSQMWT